MKNLRLSRGLTLPLDAVTQTFGILAKRGAGKSNVAAVMAEEMFEASLPFVVVDPVGAWWGLRSSKDGKGPGLSIPIFGGYRGDVPLERGGAELVADLVVDQSMSCVLDVSAFESERAKREFLTAFAERLFRRKGQPGNAGPLHLFLEEADDYAPQRHSGPEMARCLGAFQRIVKQGRARGLGSTMISQRSASLNKDLLTQIETLIVLRTTSPQDRKAVSLWVEYHGQSEELLASLHELKDGEAWIWSPWLDIVKRVQIRRRATFDSGATPTMVSSKKTRTTLADVDLDSLRERMADTIKRAKEEDPRELRRRIRELEDALSQRPVETKTERVEVPVVPDGFSESLTEALKVVERTGNDLSIVGDALSEMRSLVGRVQDARVTTNTEAVATPPVRPAAASPRVASEPSDLGKPERAVLSVLAQFPQGRTPAQLALLTGYSARSSTISVVLSKLRRRDYVLHGQPVRASVQGLSAIRGHYEELPTGRGLLEYWFRELGKTGRAVLEVLVETYPHQTSLEEVASKTGYSPDSSTISVAMSRLRRLEIVKGWTLTQDFAEAVDLITVAR